MNKSKLALALTVAAFTSTVMASSLHQHPEGTSCNLHGHSFITPEGIAAKETARSRLGMQVKNQRLSIQASPATIESPAVIDVVVVLHKTYIDDLKIQLTKDSEGRFYENGAQFAVERTKAQYAYFNESLRLQNVPVVLRPVYFGVVDFDTDGVDSIEELRKEFFKVNDCMTLKVGERKIQRDGYMITDEICNQSGLDRLSSFTQPSTDLFHFIKARNGASVGGLGYYYAGISDYQEYSYLTKLLMTGADKDGLPFTPNDIDSFRFGHVGAGTVTHEFGHVFGGMHEVSQAEPANGSDNREYSCGKRDLRADTSAGEPKKRTALWSTGGWVTDTVHRFYSNPDITVDGDACGVHGEANNLKVVKENSPLVAQIKPGATESSVIEFVLDTYQATRNEATVPVVIRRIGDIAKPANISITAKDGTAWEGRDFDFGLQEISFAAGEVEKTIRVTLLPRAERHSDTEFKLQINGAIGATYPEQGPTIRIVSENPLSIGTVQFSTIVNSTVEGDLARLTVTRQDGQDSDIEFTVAATDGSAKAGTDYTFTSHVIAMASGETQAVIEVPTTVRTGKQGPRNVNFSISAVSDGVKLGVSQTTLTINDKAESGTLAFGSGASSVTEGGTVNLTIERTAGTEGAVSVRVRTVNGVAIAGTDFTALDQVVTIADGQSSASVSVLTLSRTGNQGARSFDINLADIAGGAQIGGVASTRITIADTTSTEGPENSGSGGGSMSWWMLFSVCILVRLRKR